MAKGKIPKLRAGVTFGTDEERWIPDQVRKDRGEEKLKFNAHFGGTLSPREKKLGGDPK
jgi:hypothetical protein